MYSRHCIFAPLHSRHCIRAIAYSRHWMAIQFGTGNGRCDFSITSGSGITSCMRPKNDTSGSWVSWGTTGFCVSTKFVELMPNRADSMSTELRENASRGIWLGVMPMHGMAGL